MLSSISLGRLIKWGVLSLVAYLVITVAIPSYFGAWRLKKATDQVIQLAAGKARYEIRDDLLARKEARAVGLEKADVAVSGIDGRYSISSTYVASKKLPFSMTLELQFNIRSDDSALW